MMKILILLGIIALFGIISFPAIAATRFDKNETPEVRTNRIVDSNSFVKQSKKQARTERRQRRLAKKLEKWKTKLQRGDRISLAWIGVIVMLLGGLFIVLGLVIPYVGLLFLILGIIVAFAGLLLTLLLGGLSVEKD